MKTNFTTPQDIKKHIDSISFREEIEKLAKFKFENGYNDHFLNWLWAEYELKQEYYNTAKSLVKNMLGKTYFYIEEHSHCGNVNPNFNSSWGSVCVKAIVKEVKNSQYFKVSCKLPKNNEKSVWKDVEVNEDNIWLDSEHTDCYGSKVNKTNIQFRNTPYFHFFETEEEAFNEFAKKKNPEGYQVGDKIYKVMEFREDATPVEFTITEISYRGPGIGLKIKESSGEIHQFGFFDLKNDQGTFFKKTYKEALDYFNEFVESERTHNPHFNEMFNQ